jgi:predicted  nucleic acid-binding Zn-ribbon protein
MHPDVVKLLDLQNKDLDLLEIDTRLADVADAEAGLDRALEEAEQMVSTSAQAVADAVQRRAELEVKIETYRAQQERRRQAIEITHPGKRAATLMAELDLARSVLAQEESEWVRLADRVTSLEGQVTEAEARLLSGPSSMNGKRTSNANETPRSRHGPRAPPAWTSVSSHATTASDGIAPRWWSCR